MVVKLMESAITISLWVCLGGFKIQLMSWKDLTAVGDDNILWIGVLE